MVRRSSFVTIMPGSFLFCFLIHFISKFNHSYMDAASCISTLIRRNSTITDIGIEENNISDAGARMLADALSHNSTLQTLKLNGNNIDSFDTMILINEKLKKNKDCAKQKLLEEHPEYGMQKIKKEKKKNRGSKSEKVKSEMKSDDAKANAGIPKSEVPSGCARDNAGITNELQSSKNSFDKVEPSQKIMTDNFKSGLKVRTKQNSARGSTNKQEGTFC